MSDTPVTIHRSGQCYNGYTLFCHTYEDAQTGRGGVAHMVLIDMGGNPVHEWTARTAVQLLELLPDGSLYYSTRDRSNLDQAGVYRIAPDSRVLWKYHCRFDHDFCAMDNGHMMILCVIDKMVPRLGPELRRNPYIIEVDVDTKELVWEWYGEEHVQELIDLCKLEVPINWPKRVQQEMEERMAWQERLQETTPEQREAFAQLQLDTFIFDWAHNNTCDVMPDNSSAAHDSRFRAGNIVFSYRSLDIIGIIDRASGEIVWAWGPGQLDGQHDPRMLSNGHILVYDNGTRRGWSRVVELDPLSQEIVWEYTGVPKRSFFSPYISGAQLLPNDNIIICEGGSGRLFEVTRDREIVWEYRSPYADAGTHGVYRAIRYAPEFLEPWLEGART